MAGCDINNPKYLVSFIICSNSMIKERQVMYFDNADTAKAMYDSLVDNDLIWELSFSEIKAYSS